MRLLLTVTRADELPVALGAGADLVDVKDPSRGSLGPPRPEVLAGVAARLAGRAPLGVPLGDGPHRPDRLAARVEAAEAAGAAYLKVGLLEARAGAAGERSAARAVATARRARDAAGGESVLMAVAFADTPAGAAPSPETAVGTAAAAGADGVMLDTLGKGDGSVLHRIGRARLRRWARAARDLGLLTALAGGLDAPAVGRLDGVGLDVVGVRGGACSGGRDGRLDPDRCRAVRRAVDGADGARAGGAPRLTPAGWRRSGRPSASAASGADDGR